MDALTALHTRNSCGQLTEPAPSALQREHIFQAALRVPDHAQLRPWQFLIFENEARYLLGDIFAQASLQKNPTLSADQLERARHLPLRAPLLIAVIAKTSNHPKVPTIEQIISAGNAAYAMEIAAHALGFGAIWRTGELAYDDFVKTSLNINKESHIVGFLYIGTIVGSPKKISPLNPNDYFKNWSKPS
jgi:nitroreductase